MRLTLLISLAVVASGTEQSSGKFFDGGFYNDGANMHWRGQLDLSNLRDTMALVSSSLDTALDHLTDRIEERVQTTLPLWMKRKPHITSLISLPSDLEGLDAISGTFGGEGVDDGLKVHINGDLEGVDPNEPRFEEPSPGEEDEDEDEEEVEEEEEVGEEDDLVGVVEPNKPYLPNFSFNPFNPFRPFGNGRPGNPGFNLFNFGRRRRQWWKGANVCVDREEIDEGKEASEDTDGVRITGGNTFLFTFGNMEMTSCSETRDKYTCVSRNSRRGIHKTVVVTYRCCHGYDRQASGCTRVEMQNMADTLQALGATDFLTLAKATGMVDKLDQNLTIFVPTNEALQEFTAELEAENELDNDRSLNEVYYHHRHRREADTLSMVMAHMTPGIHYATDLHDEQVLKSVMEDSILRINTYATTPPTATVNCARLTDVDQHTTNGVVHTINTVLHPVTSSLADLITADPQFSILSKLMDQAKLFGKLSTEGQLTLFAPTDAAFNSLPTLTLEGLLENTACLDAVMKNHLLPNVICSAAVQGKARTVNLLDAYLLLELTEDDELMVGGEDGSKVVARDIVATNGVMHVIDSPLLPREAKPVLDVLEDRNLTQFLTLLETAGMLEELAGLSDVTIFAPSNKAIEELPEEVLERLTSDPTKLRDILRYHVATPALQAEDIANNHVAATRADHPLRINLYTRTPLLVRLGNGHSGMRMTAGCSRVSVLDQRACGAVVHIVERLLSVPKESVMDQLVDSDKFSIFTKMLKDTGMEETLRGEGPFTVLAPSDHVFRSLPEVELNHILDNSELQEELVQQHILQEHVCCTGINPNTWFFVDHKRPLAGSPIHLRRSSFGHLMAGRARITHCSTPSHNGLVHTVNHLLVNVHPNSRSLDQGVFLPNFSASRFLNG